MRNAINTEALVAHWKHSGADMLAPVDALQVKQAFAAAGSIASADVIALYGILGGMWQMDGEYWRLWSLDEIIVANDASSDAGILFSDYCMDCYHFRLKYIDEMVSEVWYEGYDDGPAVRVAASLSDFLDRYMRNPDAVLHAPGG
ncbi:hypothetical protein [Massilia antarctica]|uniref:hypothetical protein n=1 Tax=Massilia antarctica TaxID=2765360 RepID=UPI0006BB9461|nr:hypothetical protein [Massilia sp. H27-R4]MCY0913275.1 hypothetical protein [Massilia sp. H27-R4]CUI07907.1 hypothetical protein BN2497_10591 [Janthinobacterium sp. CG23_2]CUU31693.1 hypothetical protein BN3177_10591 [Janthinobacterium sp. CG23_2]